MATDTKTAHMTTENSRVQLNHNQAMLQGRIDSVRKGEEFLYTALTLPAPDQFSQPAMVEVRSKKRLGQTGDMIECLVACGGYRGKVFTYVDKETGERFTRRPVANAYHAVED